MSAENPIGRRELPLQERSAALSPQTADAEARTVEMVWSTGAKVRRYDFWSDETYEEELSLDPAHVDMSRLTSGAPVLNTHDRFDLSGVIGVVDRAWIESKDGVAEGRAVVRLSDRKEVE